MPTITDSDMVKNKKDMTKEEYIGTYVGKKMKNNKLPYGLAYLNLVADLEEIGEKYWERMMREKLNKKS